MIQGVRVNSAMPIEIIERLRKPRLKNNSGFKINIPVATKIGDIRNKTVFSKVISSLIMFLESMRASLTFSTLRLSISYFVLVV